MTFDENEADREPPEHGGFFIATKRHIRSIKKEVQKESKIIFVTYVPFCG